MYLIIFFTNFIVKINKKSAKLQQSDLFSKLSKIRIKLFLLFFYINILN